MTTRRYDPADYGSIYGSQLRSNQIRLLEISAPSDRTGTVYGTLKTYELGETDFTAVSYVWGDESKLVPIRLNGCQFWVTQNANSILRLLSRVSAQDHTAENDKRTVFTKIWVDATLKLLGRRDNAAQYDELKIFANSKIWIDAISIDQADRPEKEVQVAKMREIYQAAGRTLIWLGAPEAESRQSRAAMIWLTELVESMPWDSFIEGPDARQHLWNDDAYSSVCHMMGQPWFRRRWVVQEVAVSQNPLVVYGTQVLYWSVFNQAIEKIGWLYADRMREPEMQLRLLELNFNPAPVWAVNRLRNAGIGLSSNLRFVDVLSDFRRYDTSNPLDRIYALLGLCKEDERAANRPDYGISIFDALIRLTVSHITVHNDLDILCLATESARIPSNTEPYREGDPKIDPVPTKFSEATFIADLPTWVPNLTSIHSEWMLGRDHHMMHSKTFSPLFNASSGLPANVHNLETCWSSKTLVLDAIEIDEIEAIEPHTPVIYPDDTDPHATVFEQTWAFAQLHWKPQISYSTSLALLTAYFRTIAAGGLRYATRDILTDAFLRHYCLKFFSPAKFGQLLISEYGMEPKPPLEQHYEDPKAGPEYTSPARVFFNRLNRYAFASTKSGRLALVPPLTQHGDRIFVLYGCTSPLLLRENPQRPGRYETNGEAYIDGFMYGEAIQHEMDGLLTRRTIVLE